MKAKKGIWLVLFVMSGFAMLFTTNCKKDDPSPGNPTNGKTTAIFNSSLEYGKMTDQDGNTYKTIVIGTQTWMAENLRTTRYRNGDSIPEVTDSLVWDGLKTGAYCNHNNYKSFPMIATYGRLYNWYSVSDSREIAPLGWHVPTNDEWTTLVSYLGGDSLAVMKLKERGGSHWTDFNETSDNGCGFTALPGGARFGVYFIQLGYWGYWWSATEDVNEMTAWYRSMSIQPGETITPYIWFKEAGFSVRCVKD